ncbi:MAG: hypothetical protein F6J90_23425 [Moorea sp. SIOASIH]|nr:hypothetical protein [Moorena sp. SIOASIH]
MKVGQLKVSQLKVGQLKVGRKAKVIKTSLNLPFGNAKGEQPKQTFNSHKP